MTRQMILLSTNHPFLRFASRDVLRVLQQVYRGEEQELPSLAIVFTHNRYIKKINREFLNHDYITDVIAFPLGNDGGVEAEIYINLDAARKQAREFGVTYTQEAKRLLIHGALHLLGYSDRTKKQKEIMHTYEELYLELLKRKRKK